MQESYNTGESTIHKVDLDTIRVEKRDRRIYCMCTLTPAGVFLSLYFTQASGCSHLKLSAWIGKTAAA